MESFISGDGNSGLSARGRIDHTRWRLTSVPGPGVPLVLAGHGMLADVQRPERVHHDRQFVEVVHADGALRGTRLWPVGEPARMQADRSLLDAGAAARLVISAGVEEH